jgi:two-component system capsular synthesis sensor histidine kinase RcsC
MKDSAVENVHESDPRKKALVIDDSFLSRRLHVENLKQVNILSIEAENGKEALEILERDGIDAYSLIVLDMLMPVMNGGQFMMQLKNKHSKLPPVIACSSKADADLIRTLAKLGVDAYVIKPVNPKIFMEKVRRFVD